MQVKTDTIIRTITLVLALVNQILTSTGHSMIPVSDEQVASLISIIITVASSLWAWWKNNSFTQEALMADDFMQQLKNKE